VPFPPATSCSLPASPDWTSVSPALGAAIASLEASMDSVESSANATIAQLNGIKQPLDSVVLELDKIDKLLNDEIRRSDTYVALIQESVAEIDDVSDNAKANMKDLKKLDPSLATKVVRPITQSFTALLKDVKDVQIAFPILLSTVIVFISLLFSNMITLLEINSKAYTRNILAPIDDLIYTIGMAITNFAIISIQVIVLLLVAQFNFSIDVWGHLSTALPVIVVMMFIFIFLGMIIAYLSSNMQTSILLSTFVALGFFLFSDALNALEAMPVVAGIAAIFNPVVIANKMFGMIFFFSAKLWARPLNMTLLLLYLIGSGVLLVWISKKKNRQRF